MEAKNKEPGAPAPTPVPPPGQGAKSENQPAVYHPPFLSLSVVRRGTAAGPAAAAGLLLGLLLALAYGPAKLQGHLLYTGVIQDLTNLYGFFAWDEFSRAELTAGRFPLWNPHNAFGVPHLANMQSAVFFPLNWVKWGFGFWPVIDLLLLARLWLAGIFTFLFVRSSLRLPLFPAFLSSSAFLLSGYLTRYLYMAHLNVEILLPLQFFLLHRLAEKTSAGRIIAAALGFALLILGGFPEAALYAAACPLAYYFFRVIHGREKNSSLRRLLAGAAALALGLLVSSPQWLPFAEYYAHAWTYHDATAGLRAKDPRLAVALLLPWFFGENQISPAVPFAAPYLGAIPLLLALLTVFQRTPFSRRKVFFLALAFVLSGVIYGIPPFSWLGRLFPFSLTYNDKYAAPGLAFCVSVLAGMGGEELLAGRGGRAGGLAGGLLLIWIAASVVLGYRNGFAPFWALGLLRPGMVVTAAGLILMALLLTGLYQRELVNGRVFSTGLFLLCAVGLLYDHIGHTPAYHDDLPKKIRDLPKKLPPGEALLRLHADPGLADFFPDRLLPLGQDDVRSYEPLYPRRYVEFMAEVNGLSGDSVLDHYNANMIFAVEPEHLADPLLTAANLGLYVVPVPLEERLLVRQWAETAVTISPRKESWLRGMEVTAGGKSRLSLLDHAPVRIENRLFPAILRQSARMEKDGPELIELRFEIAIPDSKTVSALTQGDGVSFALVTAGEKGKRLEFARYLDPKARPEESGFKPFRIPLGRSWRSEKPAQGGGPRKIADPSAGVLELSLLPGPKNDLRQDAAAWARLRLSGLAVPAGIRELGRVGEEVTVYQHELAFPRVAWVRGMASLPDDDRYLQALHTVARNNPQIFRHVVVVREGAAEGEKGTDGEKPALKVVNSSPGRMVMEGMMPAGFVVISEQYFPGFRAFMDGEGGRRELRILEADGAFQAVPLPAGGASRLEVVYQPWAFRLGLWVGLASLLFMPVARRSARGPRPENNPTLFTAPRKI